MAKKPLPYKAMYHEYDFDVPFHIHTVRFMVYCEVSWDLWWSVDGEHWSKWSEYSDDGEIQEPFISVPINCAPMNALFMVHTSELTNTKVLITE